jgi:Flp pilus assembly protein TadG
MRRLARILRDQRGVAAIEFALIIPILAGLVLFGLDGWLRINQASQMHSAVAAGTRYYESGGSDDTAAAQLALQSWAHVPADGVISATRSCTCGGAGASCSGLCPDGVSLPQVYVTLAASGTYNGIMHSDVLTENGGVRVR